MPHCSQSPVSNPFRVNFALFLFLFLVFVCLLPVQVGDFPLLVRHLGYCVIRFSVNSFF